MWKWLLLLVPPVLLIGANILLSQVTLSLPAEIRAWLRGLVGLVLSYGLFHLVKEMVARAQLSLVVLGAWRVLGLGLLCGVILSFACGLVFGWTSSPATPDWTLLGYELHRRFLGNILPAFGEEIAFRATFVHLFAQISGLFGSLLSGSLPFGLLHLLGRLLGEPVDLQQIVGVSLGGLLLSALYLRFGLFAAIGCHWAWNAFASQWVRVYGLSLESGINEFEGASSTILVLLVANLLLILGLRKFPVCDTKRPKGSSNS